LTIPTYIDIRDDLIAEYRTLYGGDDVYLETDSADYQWICVLALRLHDVLSSIQLAYNNRAPQTAIGSGLDQIVKLNGITRTPASYSTCTVKLTGTIGTVITDGVVVDSSGNRWDLPASVTLVAIGSPAVGEASVTVTSQVIGVITAQIGDINVIATPQSGWTAVINDAVAAVVGDPVETDVQLRERQALSATRPSMNLLTGTISAIAAMTNVSRYNVVENYTSITDVDGNPPHSITCVVEGDTDEAVADTIWDNRGIGCYTNGGPLVGDPSYDADYNKHVEVTDPVTLTKTTISFYRPLYVPVYVTVTVYPLDGYTTSTAAAIQQAITD
jgi:hypothetical protein